MEERIFLGILTICRFFFCFFFFLVGGGGGQFQNWLFFLGQNSR